jgi:hypothetical protein
MAVARFKERKAKGFATPDADDQIPEGHLLPTALPLKVPGSA